MTPAQLTAWHARFPATTLVNTTTGNASRAHRLLRALRHHARQGWVVYR